LKNISSQQQANEPTPKTMKILIIDEFVPYPPNDGGKLRVYNLIRQISRDHEVSLVSLYRASAGDQHGVDHLRNFCTRIELVNRPKRSTREYRLLELRAALKREPIRNMEVRSEKLAQTIETLTKNEPFDAIDIQRPCMAPYVRSIASTCTSRKILTLYDVPYVQYRRMMKVERNWGMKRWLFMNWLFSKRATLKYARHFDKTIMVSDVDCTTLKQAQPDLDISIVPNGVDTTTYPPLAEQNPTPTLLFVGKMDYAPNVDSAIFFAQEIFPLIQQQIPEANLLIVGQKPRGVIQALASTNITVTGYVESVVPYYQRASVSIVPLRSGSGTRLKILESMAFGRPVISTSLGSEGLAVTHGENILIADTPADFAAQAVRLLSENALRKRLIANGRRLVETTYDWGMIARQLIQAYEETPGRHPTTKSNEKK